MLKQKQHLQLNACHSFRASQKNLHLTKLFGLCTIMFWKNTRLEDILAAWAEDYLSSEMFSIGCANFKSLGYLLQSRKVHQEWHWGKKPSTMTHEKKSSESQCIDALVVNCKHIVLTCVKKVLDIFS